MRHTKQTVAGQKLAVSFSTKLAHYMDIYKQLGSGISARPRLNNQTEYQKTRVASAEH